MQAKQLKVTPK